MREKPRVFSIKQIQQYLKNTIRRQVPNGIVIYGDAVQQTKQLELILYQNNQARKHLLKLKQKKKKLKKMEIGLVNRTQRLDSRKYRICMKAIQRIDVAQQYQTQNSRSSKSHNIKIIENRT